MEGVGDGAVVVVAVGVVIVVVVFVMVGVEAMVVGGVGGWVAGTRRLTVTGSRALLPGELRRKSGGIGHGSGKEAAVVIFAAEIPASCLVCIRT